MLFPADIIVVNGDHAGRNKGRKGRWSAAKGVSGNALESPAISQISHRPHQINLGTPHLYVPRRDANSSLIRRFQPVPPISAPRMPATDGDQLSSNKRNGSQGHDPTISPPPTKRKVQSAMSGKTGSISAR